MDNLELMQLMRRCGHALHHRGAPNASQRRVIMLLARHGSMTQKALGERMRIQPGSLSEVLSKVEQAGLVEKARDEADRRSFALTLTAAGHAQAGEYARQRAEAAQQLFAPLSDEQKQTLGALLTMLLDNWEGDAPC